MNCRTHEHRHFERILRTCACCTSMFGSGSVETSIGASLLRSGSSHRLRSAGGLKLTCAVPLPRDSWVLKHLGLGWNQPARGFYREVCACLINQLTFRPDIKQDYPPNLSILISGGKELTICISLSHSRIIQHSYGFQSEKFNNQNLILPSIRNS